MSTEMTKCSYCHKVIPRKVDDGWLYKLQFSTEIDEFGDLEDPEEECFCSWDCLVDWVNKEATTTYRVVRKFPE